ncbi:MAG: class I SAM-dependent methyltransferase [Candidatus Wenzhouxiangella sp. M2_3B_020]
MRGIEQIPWLYDLGMAFLPGLRRWRRSLAELARGRVLEVGCGTGRMLALYPDDCEVVGFDPNRESLDRAHRRRSDALLFAGVAEHLPFPDESFDTVACGLVFCGVSDPGQGLAEIHRVLRPDGRLVMLEHVHANNRFGRWLLDTLQPPWTWITGGCRPNRETERAVERAGFRVEPDHYRSRALMRHFTARKD